MSESLARHRPKGRFVVRRVKLTMGKTMSPGSVDGAVQQINMRNGGMIRAISVDYSAAANAAGVVTIKENTSTGVTLFTTGATATRTTNANNGVLVGVTTDQLSGANALVADQTGLYFATGLNLAYTSATAGDFAVVRLLIDTSIRYIKKSIALTGADGSATGSVNFFMGRPGVLRAIRMNAAGNATADLTVAVDADNRGSNAGSNVFTATNYGATPIGSAATAGMAAGIQLAGIDEVNAAAAGNPGHGAAFMHGLKATVAQAQAADKPVIEFWIES